MRRRFTHPVSVVAGLFCASLIATPVAAQSSGPWVCMTRDFTKRVAYVSPVFNVKQADAIQVNPAWHKVMTEKYGITALPYRSCQGPYPSAIIADSARMRFMDAIRTTFHQQVNELGWTYAGAAVVTVAHAPPAAAASPAAPAAPASLTAADRAAFQAEVPQSKGYCEQNYRGLYDCDRFAQVVLQHRLAHPEEWEVQKGGQRRRPPIHDLAIGIEFKLDCTDCLNDELLASWARHQVEGNMSQLLMEKMTTQAKVDARAACVSKAFVKHMRADPWLHQYQANFNAAGLDCGNPNG
jgi:hypothetical protein